MQQSSSAQDHADQVLHDQLLAAQQHLQSQGQESRQPPSQQGHNIDPAISGGAMLAPNTQGSSLVLPQVLSGVQEAAAGSDASRKTYGKRELSTSKRAEQNRAAQRAFRQRKEGYIRQLEAQVKDYKVLSESYKALQAENYQLREYIISLQSRLIDSQNEVPALPDNIDLTQPRPEPPLADSHQPESSPPSTSLPPPQQQQQPPQSQRQPQHTLAATPTAIPPLAPHQHPHQPSTAPSNPTNEDLGQLNRIAVAGLGMRKHAHSDIIANNNHNSNQNNRDHYLPEDSYPWKRPRGNDDDYVDRNSAEVKIEVVPGLPSMS
ncbi:hypothetical protein EYB26_009204 [Talaromyces marneffei]|nr:uncharacterized protein EYB26_009204 [Talaromyces marneffei]QGA21493.1 hypothetical protein EYB26_009204 [Talaromyces marneffei]